MAKSKKNVQGGAGTGRKEGEKHSAKPLWAISITALATSVATAIAIVRLPKQIEVLEANVLALTEQAGRDRSESLSARFSSGLAALEMVERHSALKRLAETDPETKVILDEIGAKLEEFVQRLSIRSGLDIYDAGVKRDGMGTVVANDGLGKSQLEVQPENALQSPAVFAEALALEAQPAYPGTYRHFGGTKEIASIGLALAAELGRIDESGRLVVASTRGESVEIGDVRLIAVHARWGLAENRLRSVSGYGAIRFKPGLPLRRTPTAYRLDTELMCPEMDPGTVIVDTSVLIVVEHSAAAGHCNWMELEQNLAASLQPLSADASGEGNHPDEMRFLGSVVLKEMQRQAQLVTASNCGHGMKVLAVVALGAGCESSDYLAWVEALGIGVPAGGGSIQAGQWQAHGSDGRFSMNLPFGAEAENFGVLVLTVGDALSGR